MALDKHTRTAIDKAAQAANYGPDEFKDKCFEVVLSAELLSSPSRLRAQDDAIGGGEADRQHDTPSLDGFLKTKRPSKERHIALVIAYHRERYAREKHTSEEDLNAAFDEVAPGTMKRINDPGQVLRDAKRARYLKAAGEGAVLLTNSGKKFVEESLPQGTGTTH